MDWLCAPRFDSDACFSALLGYDEHGRWALHPTATVLETHQRYREDTLILETEFVCEGGSVRVVDFMPMNGRCELIRIIEGVEGETPVEMLLDVRFGYGADAPLIEKRADGACFLAGPDALILHTPVVLEHDGRGVSAYLRVRKGERTAMQLTWYASHESPPEIADAEQALASTESYWKDWVARCTYHGRWRDAVVRSLITLKAMTCSPTGAIVAAPTTSLPEAIGGVRNWDYRFCWLRDASLTLHAFMIGGYIDEARSFREWLMRAVAGDPANLQIMYDISGGRRLTETELAWLPGYESSKPVRIGNAASGQFQLDVYGEVLSCLHTARRMGLPGMADGWRPVKGLLAYMEKVWQHPDSGIWEVRGGPRHFTHSKVMAWVVFDRAARMIQDFDFGGEDGRKMLPHLCALRDRIHTEVCERGFNPKVGAFTQSYGSEVLDASVLVMPHYGFLPGSDSRVQSTVTAIEKDLLRNGFVLRYDTKHGVDALPGSEGVFLACSYWLADNYAFANRLAEAEGLFERLLGIRNHVGLLAEEYDTQLERQVGNFPQAFSHLALILSASVIESMSVKGKVAVPAR
jgi:GH15 family glucan-1,4-alpha-glucosidase